MAQEPECFDESLFGIENLRTGREESGDAQE